MLSRRAGRSARSAPAASIRAGCAPTTPSPAGGSTTTRRADNSAPSPAGGAHSCGLRTDNTITCWGNRYYRQADAPDGQFSAVTAGPAHSCGLRTDNTITCWGNNDSGKADAPDVQVSAVSAGGEHSCGLRTDSTITCWGNRYYGAGRRAA